MKTTIQKALFVITCSVLFFATSAQAASITGPSTSTTGSFTLSWPAGYALRLQDASWEYAASPTTSFNFVNLPSGNYKFMLTQCVYAPPPYGPGWTCFDDTASYKTVTVTRDAESAIDTATSAAGSLAYTATTTARGSSQVAVPIRTIVGVNGLAPTLSLAYDSARASDVSEIFFHDDDLGYGWQLRGLSRIHRCRLGLTSSGAPTLDSTDRLCLDGQVLKVVTGSYWADDSVYRMEYDSQVLVTKKAGDWFEVKYPDGRVSRFGDTSASKVIGSGQFTSIFLWSQPSPTYVWAERQTTNTLGDLYTVDYEKSDQYGFIQPKAINYSNAIVEFKYGPRADTATAWFVFAGGYSYIRRSSLLHTIRVKMNGVNVREYRLDSNVDASSRNRLERIQECGYAAGGGAITCLKPLGLEWG